MLLHQFFRFIVVSFALSLAPVLTGQTTEYFLQMDRAPGMVTTAGFENQVEIQSYSLSWANTGTTHVGGGGGAGKTTLSGIDLVFNFDPKAYPAILSTLNRGNILSSVILRGRRTSGGSPALEFIKLEMTEVLVTKFVIQGHAGDRPVLNLGLIPRTVKFTTKEFTQDGLVQTFSVFGWDYAENKALP